MAEISTKKRILGWMSFDVATQPFYTLGLTFIFGPYFAIAVANYFLEGGMTETASDAQAQSIWSLGQTVAGLFIAFTAPILGAYADSTGRRLPWMILFSIIYVAGSLCLWFMVPDGSAWLFCLIAFLFAFVAAEYALIFTNAILPSLGDQDEVGKISGDGAAYGYWGGVISLFIMLLVFFELGDGVTLLGNPPPFGLDRAEEGGTRFVGIFIAAWFAIFMIPYFLFVREGEPNRGGGIAQAMTDLKTSLKGAVKRKSLFNFLLSSMFYRDALNALYTFGGVYAGLVLNWSLEQIVVFGIIAAITAAIGTTIAGRFDRAKGPRPVIMFCIWTLILVSCSIVGMSREAFYGIPLPDTPLASLPVLGDLFIADVNLYICGSLIGAAGGGIYSASRSMMVRHTHPERPTEAFGLFALSGKATAFLAPAMIAVFTYVLQDARLGFSPVIALFLLGLFLLRWVHPEGDRAEWSKEAIPVP
ncbi:MAG: MFS transporter [Pseudomonadota bacterium]